MKKVLSVFLCVVILSAGLVFSSSAKTSGVFVYEIKNGYAVITGNNSASGNITVPSSIEGKSVIAIEARAFSNNTAVTGVTVPSSVKTIGENAFIDCTSLKSISLPDSVVKISSGAFYNTAYFNLASNWSGGILYIGKHLIDVKDSYSSSPVSGKCSIKNGTITVAESAFSSCKGLTEVSIPSSVKYIGCEAFHNCTSLKNISFYGTQAQWNSIEIDDYNSVLLNATVSFAKGDINSDGKINSTDALLVLQSSTGLIKLTSAQVKEADVNGDSKVNSTDALAILRFSTGTV